MFRVVCIELAPQIVFQRNGIMLALDSTDCNSHFPTKKSGINQGTHISLTKNTFESLMFLFPRWVFVGYMKVFEGVSRPDFPPFPGWIRHLTPPKPPARGGEHPLLQEFLDG